LKKKSTSTKSTSSRSKSKYHGKKKVKVIESESEHEESESSGSEEEEDGSVTYAESSGDEVTTGTFCRLTITSPLLGRSSRVCLAPTAPSRTSIHISTMGNRKPSTSSTYTADLAQSENNEEDNIPVKARSSGQLKSRSGEATKRSRAVVDSEDKDDAMEQIKKLKMQLTRGSSSKEVNGGKTTTVKAPKPPSGFEAEKRKMSKPLTVGLKSVLLAQGTKRPYPHDSQDDEPSAAASSSRPAKKARRGWDEEVEAHEWSQATLDRLAVMLAPDVLRITGGDWETWSANPLIRPMLTQDGGLWSALRIVYHSSSKYQTALDDILVSVAKRL
jgi:hypothetical protein